MDEEVREEAVRFISFFVIDERDLTNMVSLGAAGPLPPTREALHRGKLHVASDGENPAC